MITAEAARELVEQAYKYELEEVELKISNVAKHGGSHYEFDYISEYVRNLLKRQGFVVTLNPSTTFTFIVSW